MMRGVSSEWLDDPGTQAQPAVSYAILGVGDRNWAETYQTIPKRIDQRLLELVGPPVIPRGEADTSGKTSLAPSKTSPQPCGTLAPADGTRAPAETTDGELLYELRAIDGPVTSAIDARFEGAAGNRARQCGIGRRP